MVVQTAAGRHCWVHVCMHVHPYPSHAHTGIEMNLWGVYHHFFPSNKLQFASHLYHFAVKWLQSQIKLDCLQMCDFKFQLVHSTHQTVMHETSVKHFVLLSFPHHLQDQADKTSSSCCLFYCDITYCYMTYYSGGWLVLFPSLLGWQVLVILLINYTVQCIRLIVVIIPIVLLPAFCCTSNKIIRYLLCN